MSRLKEGENPLCVQFNNLDLRVQVYNLRAGFMSERILNEVGNYTGKFVASASSNFVRFWRDYLRVRVTIDVSKPLKRRIKILNAGNEWFWISFKYENVLAFCFIYGVLGHTEKFCSSLFVTPEKEIVRPYGDFMRAHFKRHVKPIETKWLRTGMDRDERKMNPCESPTQNAQGGGYHDPLFTPANQEAGDNRGNFKITEFQNGQTGGILEIRNQHITIPIISPIAKSQEVTIVENKKRKTDDSLELSDPMGLNTEILMDSEEVHVDQTSPSNNMIPKNGEKAST